jgi:hypothetical protein
MWNWGKKEERNTASDIEVDLDQFDQIGIIDENSIEVSESDLQDPNLLAELHNLRNSDDEGDQHQQTPIFPSQFNKQEPEDEELKSETVEKDIQLDMGDIMALKQRALALKKEGKKTEALELLREVKRLQTKLPPSYEELSQGTPAVAIPPSNDRLCVAEKGDTKQPKSLEVPKLIDNVNHNVVRTQGEPLQMNLYYLS